MNEYFCLDFDDLLDLLSTDDEPPKAKNKAKIKNDTVTGKPITYDEDKEQPLEFGKDAVPKRPVASPVSRPATKGKPSSGPQINFDDDDDDDLLSGLGLDEDKRDRSAAVAQKQQGLPSSGSKGPPSSLVVPKKQGEKTKAASFSSSSTSKAGDDDTEETVQFGGYAPSVADSSRPRSSMSGRKRRAESEFLTARPSTAPNVAKKSVRFSDDLERTKRPSSPLVRGDRQKEFSKKSAEMVEEDELPPQKLKEPVSISSTPQSEDKARDMFEKAPPNGRHLSLQNSPPSPESLEPPRERSRATSEGAALEHPIFPWQKPRDGSATSGPPKKSRGDRQISDEVRSHRVYDQTNTSSEFEVDTTELKAAQEKIRQLQLDLEKEKSQLKVCDTLCLQNNYTISCRSP